MFSTLAAVALLLVPAAPVSAAPAATAPPQVRSIELSLASATVSGLETVPLNIRMRLTDDVGISNVGDNAGGWSPDLSFGPGRSAMLQLAEGTLKDGVWAGQILITSGWSGSVRPTEVWATDLDGHTLQVDPATVIDTPAVTVHSSHRPVVKLSFSPSPAFPGTAVTEIVTATDADTGNPYPFLPLSLGVDNLCPEWAGGTPATTGFYGTYQRTLDVESSDHLLNCVLVRGPDVTPPPGQKPQFTVIASDARFVTHKYRVGATPAKTSVPAGTNVKVNGTVLPLYEGKVMALQRLSGGAWLTVNTGKLSAAGRFTIVATPPGKGLYTYRVLAATDASNVGNTSVSFTIRGT
jgi:hypothetical protein